MNSDRKTNKKRDCTNYTPCGVIDTVSNSSPDSRFCYRTSIVALDKTVRHT